MSDDNPKDDIEEVDSQSTETPAGEEVNTQPTSVDLLNHGYNLVSRAVALSKGSDFKSVALSFTDLQFLQQALHASLSVSADYINIKSALLRRDPVLTDALTGLLSVSDDLIQQVDSLKLRLEDVVTLSKQLVKPK